jgi:hypothetical protein
MRRAAIAITFLLALLGADGSAHADVVIGPGVYVGGHAVTPGHYGSVTVERLHRRPPWYGCRWFAPGSVYQGKRIRVRTKICNWKN